MSYCDNWSWVNTSNMKTVNGSRERELCELVEYINKFVKKETEQLLYIDGARFNMIDTISQLKDCDVQSVVVNCNHICGIGDGYIVGGLAKLFGTDFVTTMRTNNVCLAIVNYGTDCEFTNCTTINLLYTDIQWLLDNNVRVILVGDNDGMKTLYKRLDSDIFK